MNTKRLFTYLKLFNTLLPALLTLLMLAGIFWAVLSDMPGGSRQTIDSPAGTAPGTTTSEASAPGKEVPLNVHTSHIDAGPNTLLMKIVTPKNGSGAYQSEGNETRNLLFLNDGSDKASWLFADASQAITRLELLNTEDAETPMVLYLETEQRPQKHASSSPTSAYLVSLDGLRKSVIATDVDQILSHRRHTQTLQLVYKKDKAVRVMKVSLLSFKILSDRVVATLSEVDK